MLPRIDLARLETAFAVAQRLVDTRSLPSAVLAVATSHDIVRVAAFSGEYQAREDSIFPIASISKAIITVSVMQLVQQGQLLLNQPIHFYIPEFQARDITAWHLLTHTSGLASNIPFADMIKTRPTAQDYLERAYRSDVLFEPGSQVAYNQQAFYVLADLITRLGGLPYPAYQHQYLFEPLGMRDTSYDPTGAPGRFEWLSSHDNIPNEQIPLTREE